MTPDARVPVLRQQGDGRDDRAPAVRAEGAEPARSGQPYVPAFGQNGKRDITIYQLLCHKAGILTVPTRGLDVPELLLDSRASCELITRT